jgi:Transketolase, pyrimidine binding domain
METMRERFVAAASELLDAGPRLAVVLADISADQFAPAAARHPGRVINVGIREQLQIGVTGGLALAGLRPIAHTFPSFLIEPYLAGTSNREADEALLDTPHRVLGLGVAREELRRYGTPAQHAAAHGLDAAGLRTRIAAFLG